MGLRAIKIPVTTKENSIQAARQTLPQCWFDVVKCEQGLEMLRQYQYEYDAELKIFRRAPLHNEASHAANAFELLSRVWRTQKRVEKSDDMIYDKPLTLDYLYRPETKSPAYYDRI
jgi:phage terminase large subunit